MCQTQNNKYFFALSQGLSLINIIVMIKAKLKMALMSTKILIISN